MIQYKTLQKDEINMDLFKYFIRHQKVTKCLRKKDGKWIITNDPFIDDWSEKDYEFLISCLKNTVATGGLCCGAFFENKLKGFASVESSFFGEKEKYLDLSSIHVSEDMRGKGIGKNLFMYAKNWAKEKGADKLYISAHSAVETQAFYKKMGCEEAKIYHKQHAEAEPFDCQLECRL